MASVDILRGAAMTQRQGTLKSRMALVWIAVLLVVVGTTWLIFDPLNPITERGYDHIQLGMTEREVEGVLGPPRERINLLGLGVNWSSVYMAKLERADGYTAWWECGDTRIGIQFDRIGQVVAKSYLQGPGGPPDFKVRRYRKEP